MIGAAQRDAAVAPLFIWHRHQEIVFTVTDGLQRTTRNAEFIDQRAL